MTGRLMNVPIASYRVQFNRTFGFRDAESLVPYLADLGISHIYASPIFKARQDSPHGYDVTDPNALNPELGSRADLESLLTTLRKSGIKWIQDVVPNHMAYDRGNRMLMNTLERGERSPFFSFFDIDWRHPDDELRGKVLAPFLGDSYRRCLDKGKIRLALEPQGLSVDYFGMELPLRGASYRKILGASVMKDLQRIPLPGESIPPDTCRHSSFDPDIERDGRALERFKSNLWRKYTEDDFFRRQVDARLKYFDVSRESTGAAERLGGILAEQLFRLSSWMVATKKINYRRFFNINGLICLRMENRKTFDACHVLLLDLLGRGAVSGLRIDHIDGLYDPAGYLAKLREKTRGTWIVVEKILQFDEDLPDFWPVQGTTGYDFLNYAGGVFCKNKNRLKFDRLYSEFTGTQAEPAEILYRDKAFVLKRHFSGDLDNLARLAMTEASQDRSGDHLKPEGLRAALKEMILHFPVYRTYVAGAEQRTEDETYIRQALRLALTKVPGLGKELGFIAARLLETAAPSREGRRDVIEPAFSMRFQQMSGPLTAKGFEDTFLYNFNRLVSLNEVGGFPERFGVTLEEFHRFNQRRNEQWPHSMTATATHDTKRGEDIRSRIHVLSEIPGEWGRVIRQWSGLTWDLKTKIQGLPAPDRNDEYLLYQTLVGAYPFEEGEIPRFRERVGDYFLKAVRESKRHTTWIKPNAEYEKACLRFVDGLFDPEDGRAFVKIFVPFQRKISFYGMLNSLSLTLAKMTAPGVPDFYQGSELWDLRLVDPDNRGPVDYEKRKIFLDGLRAQEASVPDALLSDLLSSMEDGRIKLFLIRRILTVRTELIAVFREGSYVPLKTGGIFRDHLLAFGRRKGGRWVVAVCPRWLTRIVRPGQFPTGRDVWRDTIVFLPDGAPAAWIDGITNRPLKSRGKLSAGSILNRFPVSLLIGQ
jgi:(1->4)-alpha-D-glucan 1-alpha-D-glucosylmutase